MGPAAPVPNSTILVPLHADALAAPEVVAVDGRDAGRAGQRGDSSSEAERKGPVGPGRATSSPGLVTWTKERGKCVAGASSQKNDRASSWRDSMSWRGEFAGASMRL